MRTPPSLKILLIISIFILLFYNIMKEPLEEAKIKLKIEKAKIDLEKINGQVRNFFEENKKLPTNLEEIPHLSSKDRFRPTKAYVYKKLNDKSWIIYSIGPDEKDDGGLVEYNPQDNFEGKGDIIIHGKVEN